MSDQFTLAVAKGRILNESLPLLAAAGIRPSEDPQKSRRLILETNVPGVRLMVIRSADVPTFVQFGAADLGIVGKDVLMEHDGEDLYEMLDLGIARCRLMVAEPSTLAATDDPAQWRRLRIATKYVHTTRRHFAAKGIQTEVIKLYGSMELAPLAGLADRIVDLVDTGNTLRANGLVEVEKITDISARLIANRAALKMRHQAVQELVNKLAAAVASAAGPGE
ncbi:MAG: ATP phosphoribosyltransferase [Gammaproteobacteria bacterium]|nr:ATP phosphoribosyltransferase [Gammaproteobacteria bacterium]